MQDIVDIGRIETSLIARRSELVQSTSFVFSAIVLVAVLGGFWWFLTVQYEINQNKPEEKRIPFTPTTWYSATRNLRSEEYAGQLQPFEIEAGHGLPGPLDGGGPAEVHGEPTEGGSA
jgi:hypothetical protein